MSDQDVTYELNLKDGLSSKIQAADGHVNHLEHSMHGLGESVMKTVEAFGISFALFKGISFVEEGMESMEKVHKSEAQLQNTMENMGTYTKESFEKAIGAAADLSKNILYSKADVIELQAQLGLVGNIGEEEMGRLTKVSADLSTKMGIGLGEAGNLLAKAINAPEMARRLGMALKIDPAVMEHVQNLAKHGKEAEARMELLGIAESKVGGAAEAAFNADPMARFNKTMGSLKNDVGGLAIDLLKRLTPALEWTANAFKEASKWIKEHKQLVEIVGSVLIGVGTGIMIVVTAMKIWTGVQWALNAAMTANPISIIIVAIGAVVGWVIYAYKHFATWRAVVTGLWEVIKEFARIVADIFMGLWHTIHGVFTFNPSEVKDGLLQQADAMLDAGKRLAGAFSKGYDDGMKGFAEDHKSLIPEPDGKPGKGAKPKTTQPPTEPKTKATGSKSVTINVSIKDLVQTLNVNSTTFKEAPAKIKEMIVAVLADATNDFQIVAANH